MLRTLTATTRSWAPLPLRLILAIIFVQHGAEKVLGAFGGDGWHVWLSSAQYVPFAFMRPTWLWLAAAALTEFLGGALLALGLLTRLSAGLISCVLCTAIAVVHLPAFYQLALLAMSGSLIISGGGRLSLDLWLTAPTPLAAAA